MLKISAVYFMWNPEICQDAPNCGLDDLVLSVSHLSTAVAWREKISKYFVFYKKDQIILPMDWGILADFWVPNEIDSWNFHHMLDLWFCEAFQNLSSFRQLNISLFQGNLQKNKQWIVFEFFPFGPTYVRMKIKVV